MIRKEEINLGAQYFAPGQIWWFDLSAYKYKSEENPHNRRPYLVIASVGRRVYVTPVTHANVKGSNFRFAIPMIESDKIDGTANISYVCMDNIQQIRVDSYVADGGTYRYGGCITPSVMQKLLSGFIASVLLNNYESIFVDAAFDMALDLLDKRGDYNITGFTPCIVHGDAVLITDNDPIEYKKDYRMIDTINAQNNRSIANARRNNLTNNTIDETTDTDLAVDSNALEEDTGDNAVNEVSAENEVSTEYNETSKTARKNTKYDSASIERGAITFTSDELAEKFAKSLIEADPNGRMTVIDFQKEFTRTTGSFLNAVPAGRILKDMANSRSFDGMTSTYGCVFKKDILKGLSRKCPIEKFNKKQKLMDELKSDMEEYGKNVAGYKWGYSPTYLYALLK